MLKHTQRLLAIAALLGSAAAGAAIPEPWIVNSGSSSTVVRVLDDDLLHISFRHDRTSNFSNSPIAVTEMVFKQDYTGPQEYRTISNGFETRELRVTFANECISLVEINQGNRQTATLCPAIFDATWRGVAVENRGVNSVYGLGQNWRPIDYSNGGKVNGERLAEGGFGTSGSHGTSFSNITYSDGKYAGGTAPNLQFPVMYALGDNGLNYALFVDSKLKTEFNLSGSWWQLRNRQASETNLYYLSGNNLPNLRSDFMELVGRPPVPPKKVFGLWVSEFSYDNWTELDNTIAGLRNQGFPVDGAMLDIAWFGFKHASQLNSPFSPMGDLKFDAGSFPNAASKLAALRNDHIGIMAIEESYVSKQGNIGGANYQGLLSRNGFARRCDNGQPIEFNNWFGQSGMIDWSNTNAANWWHDQVRKPNLIDLGVMGHWTDLGEPEAYDAGACYNLGQHVKDYHNVHNLLWSKSIYDGYRRNHNSVQRRPFSLARAGTVGSQRFGAGLWSGDIGGRLDHMNLHYNNQMHMSMAGVDYYSSDIGGFWRKADETGRRDTALSNGNYSEDEMYSLWFANAAWLDIPLRPHGNNCGMPGASGSDCILTRTSPAAIGNIAGNRINLRQRYELVPYYYSLAHRAFLYGEPVVAPMAFYFQNDSALRGMADQKMLGQSLLVASITQQFQASRNVYLPAGTWYNYHTLQKHSSSTGQTLANVGLWNAADSQNRVPVFVRAGAIIPMMYVDSQTKDIFGNRRDGSVRNELILNIFPGDEASEFTLYEDDGTNLVNYNSNGVPNYLVRATRISQQPASNSVNIHIGAASSDYVGALTQRNNEVRYLLNGASVASVQLDGVDLPNITRSQFNSSDAKGWLKEGDRLFIRTGIIPVSLEKSLNVRFGSGCTVNCEGDYQRTVVFMYGTTIVGQDMFIRGGIDHIYARTQLGRDCDANRDLCAIPIRHLNMRNATTAPWKINDTKLDWHGTETGQNSAAVGSPLDWTTWMNSGQTATVAVNGYGKTPLNLWGDHYWMFEVEMDCSKTVNGWFELKSFISNGPGWEGDVNQPGKPYASGNHFAQCGKLNVFRRGESNPVTIGNL